MGRYDPRDIEGFRAQGGFQGSRRALRMQPGDVLNEVERAGLRGRGGAGFPVARKWAAAVASEQQPKYLVCNGDEGELGTCKDKLLLENDPWEILEGIIIAAYATGASRIFLYLRNDYTEAFELWKSLVDKASADGLFGELAVAPGCRNETDIQFHVARGRGLYIAGEEMALVASLGAARPVSAPKPPYPASCGLFGKPTVIHNVETLANLPAIMSDGADAFRKVGTENEPGTRLFCLSGDVKRPGVYELPIGACSLNEFIREYGGGTIDGNPPKAVQPGGGTSALLGADALDCPLTDADLRRAGSAAGTGGVIVYGQERDAVEIVHKLLDYYGRESCGRCMPCRVGSVEMRKIVDRLVSGAAAPNDLERLRVAGETCAQLSTCGMGQCFPDPVLSAMNLFPEDFARRATAQKAKVQLGEEKS